MSKTVIRLAILGILCQLTSCAILKRHQEPTKAAQLEQEEPKPQVRRSPKKVRPKPSPAATSTPKPQPTSTPQSVTLKEQSEPVTAPTVYDSAEGPRHPIQLQ